MHTVLLLVFVNLFHNFFRCSCTEMCRLFSPCPERTFFLLFILYFRIEEIKIFVFPSSMMFIVLCKFKCLFNFAYNEILTVFFFFRKEKKNVFFVVFHFFLSFSLVIVFDGVHKFLALNFTWFRFCYLVWCLQTFCEWNFDIDFDANDPFCERLLLTTTVGCATIWMFFSLFMQKIQLQTVSMAWHVMQTYTYTHMCFTSTEVIDKNNKFFEAKCIESHTSKVIKIKH